MQVGQIISGKYRLVRLLGDGGMGSVYEAHHEKLGTRVAIKLLHPELARRAGLAERFLQEARVAAQIKSPHVVQVTDIDQIPNGDPASGPGPGAAYIVMELLEGEPLSSVLERQGKLGIGTSCEFTCQILQALEAAHALGVIHRDLKPENVFVTSVGGKPFLKLIDFGIAKLKRPESQPGAKNLTVAGVLMGTAEYMAPEQAFSADQVDARSDIYSVGVMLYEMIAGRRPVTGEDARVIAVRVERGEITPLVHAAPEVPREIAGLVHRAMASRPDLRFATAAEMRVAMERHMSAASPVWAKPEDARGAHRPPTVNLAAMSQVEAGTGTMLGAPAEALLTPSPGHVQNVGVARGQGTAIGSGTDRVAPVQLPAPVPASPRPRRSSRGWLIALLVLLGFGAVGAIVASQYDLLPRADATPDTPAVVTSPPPSPSAPPPSTAAATPTKPSDTLQPLVTPATPPPRPPTPHPRPSGSTAPPPPPSATTPDSPIPIPPFPSTLPQFPFPLPSGSGTIPFPPIPLPGFGPAPQPQPAPAPSAPAPSLPSAGY